MRWICVAFGNSFGFFWKTFSNLQAWEPGLPILPVTLFNKSDLFKGSMPFHKRMDVNERSSFGCASH
jgi:hypothetical protein